tara:strand:- start:170 stop:367 length:198 start_codon:yes stop_codon:yes gene_type:complete
MEKMRDKLLYFISKSRIDGLEGDKERLRQTILKKNDEISDIKEIISSLHNKIEELNWIIENKRTY